MHLNISGREAIELKHIVFDYNGTIAIDGKLIKDVSDNINSLAKLFTFHVITADTYGSVEKELSGTNCKIVKIPKGNQDISKLNLVKELGSNLTLAAGNGRNDKLMLKEAVIGIALLQEEGLCTETLLASDIVCKSIDDLFSFLREKNKFIAALRN